MAATSSAVYPFLSFLWHQRAILTTRVCARLTFVRLCVGQQLQFDNFFQLQNLEDGKLECNVALRFMTCLNVQDKRKLHAPLITTWQLQGNHILFSSKYTNLWNAGRNRENKNVSRARGEVSDWLKPCQLLIWAEGLATALFLFLFSFNIRCWTC